MMNFYKSTALAAIAVACVSYPAVAQTMTPDPGHPRIGEVDQRLANVQAEVTSDASSGKLHPRQAARDQEHLSKLSQELQADEAANNGQISRHEQIKLNHQLDHMETHIQKQISGVSTMAAPPAGTMVPPPGNPPPPAGQ